MGLDIGSSAVRAAQVSWGKGATTLERFGQVSLPAGAVRGGEVMDPQTVAEALKRLWSQVRFSTKKVVVGVANQKVVVRQVDLPKLPAGELTKSLAYHVGDYIPMPVDQAILDYHPLQELRDEQGNAILRVLLVAASREMVNSTVRAVQLAGLKPTMVDLTPFAVLRALVPAGGEVAGAEALVEVGSNITNIIVHEGGVPRFVRILPSGGADVTAAVADRMGVATDQAEDVKVAMGLADGQAEHPASRVLDAAGTAWVEEIRGSLDYFRAQATDVRVARLVLSGGGAQLGGLAERLSAATRLPVEMASCVSALHIGRTGLSREQLSSADPVVTVPVGLALGVAA